VPFQAEVLNDSGRIIEQLRVHLKVLDMANRANRPPIKDSTTRCARPNASLPLCGISDGACAEGSNHAKSLSPVMVIFGT